ncbi:acyltransferase family protein [Microbacterium sp. JZ37]|uniref:acyltransferase family protein n=1 Tax=Microbacterium sp. JZ37 TaxID=2654193 RepID=UPI002B475577|nr:acyltransferase family protein [Microbacterium sp. JZ37]WRH18249.1 acyltransferase family protein [Microbacterium sp. JZ37]
MASKRLDIQGLRALAVLLVVIYHLWPSRVPGGFIGVDVFFVISGYLITAHLLREVENTGTVALSQFWARRIRRLLPASLLVLLASFGLAVAVMPGSVMPQNLSEIGASALYVLNWLLAVNAVDYLAAENSPSLVQHFWSLSVEEQFYIAWPLLILLVLLLARKVRGNQRHAIGVGIAVVFVLSLAVSIWATSEYPSIAYFATPVRAWEFAAGGLLVFLPALSRAPQPSRVVASWFGLAAILVPAFVFDANTPFPGWTALIPVIGTALLIHIGDPDSNWAPQFLARHGLVQFIGDNSYSIYLWHWPLIVAYPVATGRLLGPRSGLVILAATIVLAVLTQRYVETPLRRSAGPLRSRRPTYAFMALGMVAIVAVTGGTSYAVATADERYESSIEAELENREGCFGAYALDNHCSDPFAVTGTVNPAYTSSDIYYKRGISMNAPCTTSAEGVKHCELGEMDDPALTAAFVGDSHSHHLWEAMHLVGKELGWRVLAYQSPGCSGFDVPREEKNAEDQARIDNCVEWGEKVREELAANEALEALVFSNRAHTKKTDAATAADMLAPLLAGGREVVALTDVPGMPERVRAPECVESERSEYDPCSWERPERPNFLADAVRASGGDVVDLGSRLCTGGKCHAVIGGTIVYFDSNHLATAFSRSLAPWLAHQLEDATAVTSPES